MAPIKPKEAAQGQLNSVLVLAVGAGVILGGHWLWDQLKRYVK